MSLLNQQPEGTYGTWLYGSINPPTNTGYVELISGFISTNFAYNITLNVYVKYYNSTPDSYDFTAPTNTSCVSTISGG
jgi:hypothetical protein